LNAEFFYFGFVLKVSPPTGGGDLEGAN